MRIRISFVFWTVFLSLTWLMNSTIAALAQTNEPTRVINIVYDDSGSMIADNKGNKCDTWCQAKYAMEVFAAMLGEKDIMNVYVMSDFQDSNDAAPLLTLAGADSMNDNVSKVHNMLTAAANYTTFATVEKAYDDLKVTLADEKWLIVLTDGEFNKPSKTSTDLENYFSQKESDISIMFLGMGPKASSINPDETNNIFFDKAETSSDILAKITGICNRIFNTNKLDVDASNGKFEFDVPMGELVVFAQGEGVKINDVKSPEGSSVYGGSEAVDVQYSDRACSNDAGKYSEPIFDTDLVGEIITYKGEYDTGVYTVEADNAKTIEVYYKPNVEIMAFLIDSEGNEIGSDETVEPGDYTLNFNFVKPGSSQKVEQSELLGDVTYSAHMTGAGADPNKLYLSGDKVSLAEGSYEIDASAELPQFYTAVSTRLNMEVFWHRELEVTSGGDAPTYYIDKDTRAGIDGFTNADEATVIRLSLDGADLSADEWNQVDTPTLEQIDNKDFRIEFTAEKSDRAGVINIYPSLKSGKTDILDEYHDIDIKVSFFVDTAGQSWEGEVVQTIPIVDNRPWYWKHLDKVWKLGVLAAILLLIAGYLPAFKKYLPKKLKGQPTIECKPNKPGQKKYERKGRYLKNRITTLIPYKAETGTIKFIPSGVSGPAMLQVKATESGRRMDVTNTSAYVNTKGLTFNGNQVDKIGKKNISLTASALIVYKTPDTTYSCTLNR